MTLETLADLVGLSTSYVQRLETGDRNLSLKHFEAFASALRVQPEDLIKAISEKDRILLSAIRQSDAATQAVIRRLAGVGDDDIVRPESPSSLEEKNFSKPK